MAKNLNLNRDTNKQFEYKTLLENESISQYGTKKCYACHKSYKGLIASHIKPYKLCVLDNDTYSRFNINNGLLLAKHIDDYFDKYDSVTAASLVAEPGASEHQTGLGVDLTCQAVIDDKLNGIENSRFGYKPDYKWCIANSYKYGYILRFEEDKANITGIANEPWHFRYVGVELAEKLYNNGNWITVEDYFGITSRY